MSEDIVVQKFASEALSLVFQLKSEGLVMGKDFTWKYIPGTYDFHTMEQDEPHAVFTFTDPKQAILYAMKWL
jgi:hypothetical protein